MPTDPDRTEEIVAAARQIRDPAERAAYLDRACDAGLRPRVDALLAADSPERTAAYPPAPDLTGDYRLDAPTDTFPPAPPAGPAPPATNPGPADATGAYAPSGADTGAYGPDPAAAGTKTFDPAAAPPAGRDAPPAGLIAGKYQIVGVIGEGGMGAVYLARQTEPIKREVALKLIKRGADSRTVVARFEAERQALALMDHPNIARVYDGGTTPTGQPFFVMELVKGVPITKYCDDNRLTPTDRLGLFVQVCRAVQHAHQKGIIHRDLKPGNILVTTVDGRPMTKVIDFGVAKAVDQRLTDESFSEEGAIVGTPTYMSPEQTDPGEVDIDTRTDVYALGVVLYELLAGAPPISAKSFRRGAILEMLRMIREQEPEHLSTKASSADALPNIAASRGLEPAQLLSVLRGDVDWITLKALEKDRERRYESANEMAADIQRYLAHEPVLARPPSRWYRLRKFVRRNRGAVAAAAVVAAALLAGAAGVTWQWREAVYQRTQADLARAAAESERDQKEAARAEAEANYRTAMEQRRVALDTVGNLVLTVRADAAGKPDMAGTVQAMVREARQSLDRIARNPDVQVSLNDTTRALLHDLNARAIRGSDPQGALREFGQAADILRAILDKAADGEWKEVVKKNLVVVLLGQGFVALQTGGQADARGYFGRAADQLDQVKDKGAADYQRLLAGVYKSLGAATADANPREAREGFRGALRVAEGLAAREAAAAGRPADDTRELLRDAHVAVGAADGRVRDAAGWEGHQAKALDLAAALATEKPDDRGRRQKLAQAHEWLADVRLRTGRPAEAAKGYAAAAAVYRELAAADPTNPDALRDLGRVTYSQGLAALRAGDRAAAGKFFAESLAPRRNRPGLAADLTAQRDLMMSLARTGGHGEAVEMAEAVRAKLPKDPGALVDIACCYAVSSAAVPAGADRDRYAAKALEALGQAIDAGYGDKVNLETEPDLDGVRVRPEFKALVDRVPEP